MIKKVIYILFISFIIFGILSLIAYAFWPRLPWPQLVSNKFSTKGFSRLLKQGLLPILGTSILLSLTAAVISSLVGLLCSRALAFYDFHGKSLLRLLLWSPLIVPTTSYFIGLEALFTKFGISDTVIGVILAHCIVILPYTVFTLEDVWKSIGQGIENQATSLGATKWQVLRHVSLPLISPALIATLGLGFVISFGQYFLTLMIGGGQVKTFALFVVPYMESDNRLLASASSLVFILVCGATYFICLKLLQRKVYQQSEPTKGDF